MPVIFTHGYKRKPAKKRAFFFFHADHHSCRPVRQALNATLRLSPDAVAIIFDILCIQETKLTIGFQGVHNACPYPRRNPRTLHPLFFGRRHALASLYEPDAVLMPRPDLQVSGIPAIREVLAGFLAMKGHFQMSPGKVVSSGDVALLFSDWTLDAVGPDGSPARLSGRRTSDVVHRQPDGRWLIVIDCPFGAA